MESIFTGRPKDTLVVRFSKKVADDVADEWRGAPDVATRTMKDGRLELTLGLYNQFWAIGMLMGFGAEAEVIEPIWLKEELAMTIRQSLAAHK